MALYKKIFLDSFYFNKFFISSSKVVSLSTMVLTIFTFFIISCVSFGINHYKDKLSQSFGAKQPHLIVTPYSDEIVMAKDDRTKVINSIEDTIGKKNIKALTPYVKTKLDLVVNIKGGIGVSKIEGSFELIGQYPRYPLAFSFDEVNYFTTPYGEITYKEFLKDFDRDKNIVVVNNVVKNGFSPMLNSFRDKGDLTVYKANNMTKTYEVSVGGSMRDYKKDAVLYTTASYVNTIADNPKDSISGFAINLYETDITYLKEVQDNLKIKFGDSYEVISWLDANKEQQELLNLYEILSYMVQALVLIASSSGILLLIFRTLLSIQPQIRSLYLMGENVGVNSVIIGVHYLMLFSLIGVGIALYFMRYFFEFDIAFLFDSGFVQRVLFIEFVFLVIFVIGLGAIFQIKKIDLK